MATATSNCLNQRRFPHIYRCYRPQNWSMGLVEGHIWDEVEGILNGHYDSTMDSLSSRFDDVGRQLAANVGRAQREIERCDLERQRILTVIRKGYVTEAEADLQFRAIREDRERWAEELARAAASRTNMEAACTAIHELMLKVAETTYAGWDGAFDLTAERKKHILDTVVDKFVLYRDGRIELRLKVPVDEAQVVETLVTASSNATILLDKNMTWL